MFWGHIRIYQLKYLFKNSFVRFESVKNNYSFNVLILKLQFRFSSGRALFGEPEICNYSMAQINFGQIWGKIWDLLIERVFLNAKKKVQTTCKSMRMNYRTKEKFYRKINFVSLNFKTEDSKQINKTLNLLFEMTVRVQIPN